MYNVYACRQVERFMQGNEIRWDYVSPYQAKKDGFWMTD